jgi:hypothetical protein
MRGGWIMGLVVLLCTGAASGSSARKMDQALRSDASLKHFLRSYAHDAVEGDDKSTRFATADLPGTRLKLVYLSGRSWCGSGGCTLLVLQREGPTFKRVSEISISRPPIVMLGMRHNGLPDIGVWVEGGGIHPGYQAALPFNGRHYADNLTVAPAHKTKARAGQVLISVETPAAPLFDWEPRQ